MSNTFLHHLLTLLNNRHTMFNIYFNKKIAFCFNK